jgi:spermidine synthase
LYALNTTGAIVGCLLSGFVLIGRLGLAETIFAAATANAVAGLGAMLLDARQLPLPREATPQFPLESTPIIPRQSPVHLPSKSTQLRPRQSPALVADESMPPLVLSRAALWAFAASGAISLAYEVVWTRILAVLFDSSCTPTPPRAQS